MAAILSLTIFFYRKLYRKLNILERYPWAIPTFWAFDRRCNSYIDGDISISKFDLFCDLVTSSMRSWIFNTRVSEVIMFSPCVFVTLFVCLCLYHDVCQDDLTMKDWCHTNNILQVHCWGCLIVQVIFHALMTTSMTSPGHKVGQILKVIYLRQYLSWSVDQKHKMSEMLMAIFLVYSTSGITSGKKVCRELKIVAILKILKN